MKKISFISLMLIAALCVNAEISTKYRLIIISRDLTSGHRRILEKKYNAWVNVSSNMPCLEPDNMVHVYDPETNLCDALCIEKSRMTETSDADWDNFFNDLPPPIAKRTVSVRV